MTIEKGSNRVLRGGSWNNNATNCRVANRNNNTPDNRNNNNGFRLVLSQLKRRGWMPTVKPIVIF
jgi:formylglycine-generating enzyme required for sulfatase activity